MAPSNTKAPIKSTESKLHNQKRSGVRNGTITPIIKIVHVYAPTLVQTDVANFRALVQEMTGNVAASHNIKDINTVSSTQASTEETGNKEVEKLEATSRHSTLSRVQARMRREDSYRIPSGAGRLQEKIRAQAIPRDQLVYFKNEEEEEGEVCEGGESSCDHSVDSFFAESEEVCVEDQFYKMQQQYCGAYFAATTSWRQPLQEIPGGFESFDYF